MARTHTHFWSSDQLEPLLEQVAVLREDYKHRIEDNRFMPSELRQAAKDRIDNLEIAVRLMGDKAD